MRHNGTLLRCMLVGTRIDANSLHVWGHLMMRGVWKGMAVRVRIRVACLTNLARSVLSRLDRSTVVVLGGRIQGMLLVLLMRMWMPLLLRGWVRRVICAVRILSVCTGGRVMNGLIMLKWRR